MRSGFGGRLCQLESHGLESCAHRSLPGFLSWEIFFFPLSKQKSLKLAGLLREKMLRYGNNSLMVETPVYAI